MAHIPDILNIEVMRVAAAMDAEFGENTEKELRLRGDAAKAWGLVITGFLWGQVLQEVKEFRDRDDISGLSVR